MAEVESYLVTGSWRHVVEDSATEPDTEPDVVLPTGHVVFTPLSPRWAIAGVPATSYSVARTKALIADGQLRDVQGREGVQLAGLIGTTPVRWKVEVHLEYNGKRIEYPDLEFELTGPAHLTALIQNDVPGSPLYVIDPRIEGLVNEAQTTLAEMQTYVDGLDQSAATADQRATDAETAAAAAATSAGASSDSATAAQTARTGSETARTEAQTARTGAETARSQAEGFASTAETHAGTAATQAAEASASALAAATSANEFDLTATSSTLAPGAAATVTVSGDGPAYALVLGIPQGDKGEQGSPGEVTTSALNTALAGKADLVGGQVPTSQLPSVALSKPSPVADRAGMLALTAEEGDVAVVTEGADKGTYMLSSGPPTEFSSWVKLTTPDAPVQAVNGQTGTVNLNAANVGARPDSYVPGWSEVTGKPATFPPTAHTHPVTDISATGRTTSNYLRGDNTWATPTDTTYAVPTQAEAEAGTATTARAFSAQRVRQAADAAITARVQLVSEFPASPVAGVLYLKAE